MNLDELKIDGHTKEPWRIDPADSIKIFAGEDEYIARTFSLDVREANARRIVACVNACRGIPQRELEIAAEDGKFFVAYQTLMKKNDRLAAQVADLQSQLDDAHKRIQHYSTKADSLLTAWDQHDAHKIAYQADFRFAYGVSVEESINGLMSQKAELLAVLQDVKYAAEFYPSCHSGRIDRCQCQRCALSRVNAALANAEKKT